MNAIVAADFFSLTTHFVFLFHLGQEMLELVYRRNETLVFR